jgi:N-acetyl-anhydromuramyl-L-alanine amidase AmpD
VNYVDLPSPNHAARPDGSVVDILVLHYTELPLQESLDILRDAKREIRVSSHYVLDLDGCRRRRGKSGLHGKTVPDNVRRGRPQGKCHREQTAGASPGRQG